MQQEFTIGKAYYLYLDTPYCDNRLSRKNEKKREMRINYLGLGFQQCMGFRATVRWTSIKQGSGCIFLLKNAVLGLGLQLRVRVGVTDRVMVKGMYCQP